MPDDDARTWTHGTRLGRDHKSVRRHLREDHGVPWAEIRRMSDGAVHGLHDGAHGTPWAYAYDLPHPVVAADTAVEGADRG